MISYQMTSYDMISHDIISYDINMISYHMIVVAAAPPRLLQVLGMELKTCSGVLENDMLHKNMKMSKSHVNINMAARKICVVSILNHDKLICFRPSYRYFCFYHKVWNYFQCQGGLVPSARGTGSPGLGWLISSPNSKNPEASLPGGKQKRNEEEGENLLFCKRGDLLLLEIQDRRFRNSFSNQIWLLSDAA